MNVATSAAWPDDDRRAEPGADAADREAVREEVGDDERDERRDQRRRAHRAVPRRLS